MQRNKKQVFVKERGSESFDPNSAGKFACLNSISKTKKEADFQVIPSQIAKLDASIPVF